MRGQQQFFTVQYSVTTDFNVMVGFSFTNQQLSYNKRQIVN